MELIKRILIATMDHAIKDELYWYFKDNEPVFFILCNDFFFWACADGEDISEKNIDLFERTLAEFDDDNAGALFCARSRGMRPQGAAYEYLPKELWPLFDACGPERPIDFFNPIKAPIA